jgi:hypothetical protein
VMRIHSTQPAQSNPRLAIGSRAAATLGNLLGMPTGFSAGTSYEHGKENSRNRIAAAVRLGGEAIFPWIRPVM